jgi:hypothetical protein
VSTHAAASPNANDAMIAAVKGPMPAIVPGPAASRGQPRAVICRAALWRRTARWL